MSDRETAYIRVLNGSHKGVVFVLSGFSVYSVGTAQECQIQVEDDECQQRHGFITSEDGAWTFRDPHGHGAHVNDIPTQKRNLEGGEIIRIGEAELYFTFRKPQSREIVPENDAPQEEPRDVEGIGLLSEAPPKRIGTIAVRKKDKVEEELGASQEHQVPDLAPRLSPVRLVVVDGDPRDIGREVVLPVAGEVLLGRSPECDFPLHDRKMSRCHCRIQPDGDRFRVSDLSSLNGTVVNGLRSASARFGVGDYIRLGFTVIACQRVREGASAS